MTCNATPLTSAADAAGYYGKDDYYLRDAKMGPPQWYGRGAEALGLVGQRMDQEQLRRIMEGELPNGQKIHRGGENQRVGVDMTFSCPKSVAMAWAAGDERVRELILNAHRAGVEAAMTYLEEGISCRRTEEKITQSETTGNLVAMRATHISSRRGDMDLHEHFVVLNCTEGSDGKWRAIDNQHLLKNQMLAGAVHFNEMRRQLEAAGLKTIDKPGAKNGEFEFAHISKEQIALFSKGRNEIIAALADKGVDIEKSSALERKIANYETRGAKENIAFAELDERWQEELHAAGVKDISNELQEHQHEHRADGFAWTRDRDPGAGTAVGEYRLGDRRDFGSTDLEHPRFAELTAGTTADAGRNGREPSADRLRDHASLSGAAALAGQHLHDLREPGIGRHQLKERDTVLSQTLPRYQRDNFGLHESHDGAGSAGTEGELTAKGQHATLTKDGAAIAAVRSAMRHHTERSSLVRENEVLRFALANHPTVSLRDAQAALATLKASDEIRQGVMNSKILERDNGRTEITAGETHLTTRQAQMRENELVDRFIAGRGQGKPIMSEAKADALLASQNAELATKGRGMNAGQLAVAKAILTSRDRDLAIQGVAGAGKTFTLANVREAAEAVANASKATGDKIRFVGLAPTHQARGELEKTLGNGMTVAEFLANPKKWDTIGPDTVIVLDEAGMLGSADFAKLRRICDQKQNRLLVAVGDRRQFAGIAAGQPFVQMQHSGVATIEMNETVRQKGAALEVADKLAQRRFDLAIQQLYDEGRVHSFETKQERYQAMASDYLKRIEGKHTPAERLDAVRCLTVSNDARREVNARVREGLGLAGKGVTVTALDARDDLSAEEKRMTKSYRVGDIIEVADDYKSLNLTKGQRAEVREIHKDHLILSNGAKFHPSHRFNLDKLKVLERVEREFAEGDMVRMRETVKDEKRQPLYKNNDYGVVKKIDGQRVELEIDGKLHTLDTKDLRVDHGYAATGYSAQGASTDAVIAEFTDERSAYTNLTRARYDMQIYGGKLEHIERAAQREAPKYNALDLEGWQRTAAAEKQTAFELPMPNAAAPKPERENDFEYSLTRSRQ